MKHENTYKKRIKEIYDEILQNGNAVEIIRYLTDIIKSEIKVGSNHTRLKKKGSKLDKLKNGYH